MFGHVYRLAEAVAEGAREIKDAEVELLQVPELCPDDVLERTGAKKAREAFAHIPVARVSDLVDADALIFGAPTRFGCMCAQMRYFVDQTDELFAQGTLVDKVGSAFTSSGSQHTGHETTITGFHTTLLHHGMIVVGLPIDSHQMKMSEITGGSPYGAGTIAGADGKRLPSENELAIARSQGRRVAAIAKKLKKKA